MSNEQTISLPKSAVELAAWICECYAEFIRDNVMSADIESHPYVPQIEGCAEDLREAIAEACATPAPGAPGQEAADNRKIVETYEKLHEGKLGAHWLWCVIEQIAAGVPEAEAFKCYGYYEAGPSRKRFDAAQEAAAPQSPELTTGPLGDITGAAVGAWQDIATAPASSETVLVVTQLGTVRTETGHYVRNMASAARANGEQCNFRAWMPAPLPPAALPAGAGEKTS